MSNKNKIILTVVALVILGLVWFYWMGGLSDYSPSSVQNEQETVVSIGINADFPEFLVGASNMTLYYKEGDLNSSSCYGQCAVNWPPLLVSGTLVGVNSVQTAALGSIDRTDGTKQATYNGKPLYYWINDKKAGDTTGDGIGGIWSVATPYF